jgi:hypothetical protein
VALVHLDRMATSDKVEWVKEIAERKLVEWGKARKLTREQVADRLVPDLGLDAQGSLLLDYGPWTFRVGFDEHLAPFVRTVEGERLAAAPRPKKSDDPEKSRAAYERWKQLKEDVELVARVQVRRLETAMCSRRTWPREDFERSVVRHPLLRHLATRLVFAVVSGREVRSTFRVAEDLSYATVEDAPFELPADATVAIPHPIELGAELASKWSGVLADYEIIQPFPQVGREVFRRSEKETEERELSRVVGAVLGSGKALHVFESRGWHRGYEGEAYVPRYSRVVPGPLHMEARLDPGLHLRELEGTTQRVVSVSLHDGTRSVAWGSVDPIVWSEVVRDIENARA